MFTNTSFLIYGQRQSIGIMFDKIISDYETIYGGQLDEDALLSRCTNTVSCLEKLIKDNSSGISSGKFLTFASSHWPFLILIVWSRALLECLYPDLISL